MVSCGTWTAEATHVWTGRGWSRLLTCPVRLVPGATAPDHAGPFAEDPGQGVLLELPRLAS
ncbi:hypothetical protein SAMN06264364_12034 [Quadrisphaera granulorum]|uniref:Uncharacterized protein n=1 Tax=Quadrisphaera granulorum TaxID=317664 RepID=A0A316A1E5_9ACTN|nr:hypothetical protein BXY45_12034 [Quadrisphaera granulorum]SZE97703.1 hypothetical protein SAMN06264364_12034 [Quadrisphaera granulorum]